MSQQPLVDQVSEQLKQAMRERDTVTVTTLRGIRAAIIEALKKDGADTLPDADVLRLIEKLAKQRRESIDAFVGGNRPELAAAERAELLVLERFIPKQADEATTRAWVEAAIAASGARGPKEMGRVMGLLMKDHRGEIDGKLANRIAGELLA